MTPIIDGEVRLHIFRDFVETGRAPSTSRLADLMGRPIEEIRAAMERLAAGKVIVLQPHSREILMAAPLSAVPTPFLVRAGGRSYFAPCVWDGLGVIAMLSATVETVATLETSCPCCGESMTIAAGGDRVAASDGIVHFAIPAKSWWDNIVFT